MNKYESYEEIIRVHGRNKFNYMFNFSLKNKYLYVENPKVASSSVKYILECLELGVSKLNINNGDPHTGVIDSPFVKPYQLNFELISELLFDKSEVFRFSIVRNPYSRVLSGYLDKIVRDKSPKITILEALGYSTDDLSRKISFLDFLRAIAETQNVANIEPHWRPQYDHLCMESIKYSYIGRFEHLNSFWDVICGKLECPPAIIKTFRPKNTTQANSLMREHYNNEAIDLVQKIYRKDFSGFNYNMEPDFL